MKNVIIALGFILFVLLTGYFIEHFVFFQNKRGNSIFYRILINSFFSGIFYLFILKKNALSFLLGFLIGIFSYIVIFYTSLEINEFYLSKIEISLETSQQLVSSIFIVLIGLAISFFSKKN